MLGNRTVFVPRSLCGAALLTALDGSFAIFYAVCRLHTKAPLFERAPLRSSAQSAYASYTQAQWFPLNTHPPRDKRSLTARGPVRGNPRRARSFGDCIITCRRPRRLTTLSPQTCTKSLTQSYLALSVRSISVQLAKCKMSAKIRSKPRIYLPACANINQDRAKNRPRNGRMDKPTKNGSNFLLSFVCRCVAVEASVFCAGANHRPRRSIPLGLSERRGEAPA